MLAMSPHTFSHHDLAPTCIAGNGRSPYCVAQSPTLLFTLSYFFNVMKNLWWIVELCVRNSEGCRDRDATSKIIWPNKELEAARAYRHQSKCDNETFYNIHDCADKFRWIVTLNNLGETQCLITSSETNADMHRSKVDVAQAQSYSLYHNNLIHSWTDIKILLYSSTTCNPALRTSIVSYSSVWTCWKQVSLPLVTAKLTLKLLLHSCWCEIKKAFIHRRLYKHMCAHFLQHLLT